MFLVIKYVVISYLLIIFLDKIRHVGYDLLRYVKEQK